MWLGERPLGRVYHDVQFEAVSNGTADDLVARGIARSQIKVIYQGVDTSTYTPDPAARSATPLFAYLGRLKRYKGVQHVIAAFARLNQPEARLAIAGAGDYRPGLEAQVRSLDLREPGSVSWTRVRSGKVDLAPPGVGADLRVAQGRVGHHQSRGRGVRHTGRRLEFAGHP